MSSLELYTGICKELGYSYVKKGSDQYDKVMEILHERKPKKILTDNEKKWNRALNELNLKYAKKGTEDYQRVIKLFKSY